MTKVLLVSYFSFIDLFSLHGCCHQTICETITDAQHVSNYIKLEAYDLVSSFLNKKM
ncbi:hypothetical protein Syun_025265 [Stephania yunnanensis]|uniref:Uncharacterized protein n=1 Tax=Stephania yunnanensis TaxID=152371 RepID=A0AAP0HW29_9MAGN